MSACPILVTSLVQGRLEAVINPLRVRFQCRRTLHLGLTPVVGNITMSKVSTYTTCLRLANGFAEGESCARIAMANSISFDEILFLNPDLNSDCTNLRPGSQYCKHSSSQFTHYACWWYTGILPVGDIETYSGYEATASGKPSSSTATVTRPAITGTRTPWDQLPEATGKRTDYPKQTEAPLAKGTRKDCEEYMENIYGKDVDCSYFRIQVPMSYFVTWNPSLFYWNCTLANSTRYCTKLGEGFTIDTSEDDAVYASVPKNAALNSTHRCFSWHNVTRGTYYTRFCQTGIYWLFQGMAAIVSERRLTLAWALFMAGM